jgi:hypothetical protein
MKELKEKIQNALDESRILVLAVQIVIGFQFRAIFQDGFQTFPYSSQYLSLFALLAALLGLSLLLWPAAFHQIAAGGHDTQPVLNFTNRVMTIALLPLLLGLGIDLHICAAKLLGDAGGLLLSAILTAGALFLWYGGRLITRGARTRSNRKAERTSAGQKSSDGSTSLSDKIKHILTEARMVLPGAQALLGFQFATFFQKQFDALQASSQQIHLLSLTLMAVSIILLMTPAAYHRIVYNGEDTEEFFQLASGLVLAAMVPLAAGVCGDFFVVTRKVSSSDPLAAAAASLLFIIFMGMWFAFTWYERTRAQK